jgi:signal transduction histidine kinase
VPHRTSDNRIPFEPTLAYGSGLTPQPTDESSRFNELVAELCAAFVRVSLPEIDDEINRSLERIARTLGLDRSTIAEFRPDGFAFFSHGWVSHESYQIVGKSLDANALLPWTKARMLAGETVVMPTVDILPDAASIDRDSFKLHGPKSNVMVPIKVSGHTLAAVGFGSMKQERSWPPRIVEQLQRMAQIFGYAFERKRATNEILRLQNELTHVSRVSTIGELAASIAHELNQPLAAILTNAEAVQSMLQAENPDLEEIKAAIADIIQDDSRAGETIRRLRSLFRRDEFKKSEVDLSEVVDETMRLLQSDAVINNVAFKIDVRERPIVLADRVQLQQVIVNLVLNAFASVSEIKEGAREVIIQVPPPEPGWSLIRVHDSGTGIPAELMPRIFDAFFSTKPRGMGMGLAISRSIVEAHGGSLSVSSIPGKQTVFEIRLPTQLESFA